MTERTAQALAQTFEWCRAHPGKKAAIVNPVGCFVVTFEPRKADGELKGIDAGHVKVVAP